ncbi:hypothetical protein [Celeribacter sp.]|uniref:hypothetical protein n=1 Tax=Celeribacter sp. TaxID=1890673 RepID=UPI003A921836
MFQRLCGSARSGKMDSRLSRGEMWKYDTLPVFWAGFARGALLSQTAIRPRHMGEPEG